MPCLEISVFLNIGTLFVGDYTMSDVLFLGITFSCVTLIYDFELLFWWPWVYRQGRMIISTLFWNQNMFWCTGIWINWKFICGDVYWTWNYEFSFGAWPCIQLIYTWPWNWIWPQPNSSSKRTFLKMNDSHLFCFWKDQ